MAWTALEFNFRDTLASSTDGPGSTIAHGGWPADEDTERYPTTRADATFGWLNEVDPWGDGADIAGHAHVRSAGYSSVWNGYRGLARYGEWRLDVTGLIKLSIACGMEAFSTNNQYIEIRDGSTVLHRIFWSQNDPGDTGNADTDRYIRNTQTLVLKGEPNGGVYGGAADTAQKVARSTFEAADADAYSFQVTIADHLVIQLVHADADSDSDITRLNWVYVEKLDVAIEPTGKIRAELAASGVTAEVTEAGYVAEIAASGHTATIES